MITTHFLKKMLGITSNEEGASGGNFGTESNNTINEQKNQEEMKHSKNTSCNNQETNRFGANSIVSQRALREIYLKGFEICIKESAPKALMTSYNLLNGIHTCERRDLIEDILRAEFGYQGVVMTDWIIGILAGRSNKYPAPDPAAIAAAGGDLVMPGGKADLKGMLKGLNEGKVTRRQLQINASRVIAMARKLNGKGQEL